MDTQPDRGGFQVSEEKTTVAVLGTGIMGAAMARNLLSAGLAVRAWNRSRQKAEPLAGAGAEVAKSPAEAAEGADFLLTMLSDARVTEETVGGGALRALAGGSGVWLQMSTVGVEGAQRLGRLSYEAGVPYVDAPVLGTKQPAEGGQLVVLASGPEEVRDKCGPVFEAVGRKTVWLGEAGAGSRFKLVANGWILGLLGALSETVALARALDVDPARFLEVIQGGPLDSPYAQLKGKMMVEGEFPTSFSAKLARKDAGLVLDAAGEKGLRLALAEAVAEHFDRAIEAGYAEHDMAALYEGVRASRRDA
jgi:3-hydroxyisobutyrate dehydrogenase